MSQKPTAAQILRSWDATKHILRKTTAWLVLLRIADAGPKGVTISELHLQHFNVPDRRLLRKYAAAGLIDIQDNHALHGSRAKLHAKYSLTEKGSALLRIQHHTTPVLA